MNNNMNNPIQKIDNYQEEWFNYFPKWVVEWCSSKCAFPIRTISTLVVVYCPDYNYLYEKGYQTLRGPLENVDAHLTGSGFKNLHEILINYEKYNDGNIVLIGDKWELIDKKTDSSQTSGYVDSIASNGFIKEGLYPTQCRLIRRHPAIDNLPGIYNNTKKQSLK